MISTVRIPGIWIYGGSVLILVAVGAACYLIDPAKQLAWLQCPVHMMTGFYCPGCGSLRATHALLIGDLQGALSYNLLTVILLPFLLFSAGSAVARSAGIIRNQGRPAHPFWAWLCFSAIVGFGVIRNLPFEAFAWLRP